MAEAMLSISNLPKDIQEKILEGMSIDLKEEVSIEIDGEVYEIASAVMGLIESLHEEIVRYREQSKFGITKD
mgnify:FL=1